MSPMFPSRKPRPPIPPELDEIADRVLSYRPKAKTKAAKRRARRKARAKK